MELQQIIMVAGITSVTSLVSNYVLQRLDLQALSRKSGGVQMQQVQGQPSHVAASASAAPAAVGSAPPSSAGCRAAEDIRNYVAQRSQGWATLTIPR